MRIHSFIMALILVGAMNAAEPPPARQQGRRPAPPAVILKEPLNWRLETMVVPPGFARDVKLKGIEEIRFAPGMFDNTADDYFTCIIAITLDDPSPLAAADLQDFLERYYGGLSRAVGARKGFTTDPARMKAVISPATPDETDRFLAEVGFFDPFTDGRHITLHVEASQQPVPSENKTGLLLLVSPSAKDSDIWTNLRQIGEKAESRWSSAQ